jgi:hypothetical protein
MASILVQPQGCAETQLVEKPPNLVFLVRFLRFYLSITSVQKMDTAC